MSGLRIFLFAAAGAYLFRNQLEAALGIGTTAAPAISAAQSAAGQAATSGATPSQQAAAAAQAVNVTFPAPINTVPSTIQGDAPAYHNALAALATATDAASLAAAESQHGLSDNSYLLTVSQWNWYHEANGPTGKIIDGSVTVPGGGPGNSAIPASQYLALRQYLGVV